MPKTVTLEQVGWRITGHAIVTLWNGGQGRIAMNETFIPFGQMTRDNLHRSINDGRFGCESIESAEVAILDAFENGYTEYNRTLCVDKPDSHLVCRGIRAG